LSVIAIRCPTCGSAAASTSNPNEYVCTHCESRFQIVRPADATVLTDTRAHHCPLCGRAVQALQSFRCTECGTADFCSNCVVSVPSLGTRRFVCRTCMNRKGWACSTCGGLATTTCISCRRRACEQHNLASFGVSEGAIAGFLTCPTCRGQLCKNCVEIRSSFFSTKYYCKKCRTELTWSQQQGRTCKFCYRTVPSGATFCTFCGKSQL
jgi:hypothetical protein